MRGCVDDRGDPADVAQPLHSEPVLAQQPIVRSDAELALAYDRSGERIQRLSKSRIRRALQVRTM